MPSSTICNPCFVIRTQARSHGTCCSTLHYWRDARLSCSFLLFFHYILSFSTCLWLPCSSYCTDAQATLLGFCHVDILSLNSRKICTKQNTAHNTPRGKKYFILFSLSFPFIISIMLLTSVSWKSTQVRELNFNTNTCTTLTSQVKIY